MALSYRNLPVHCRCLRQVVRECVCLVFSIQSLLLGWMHFHSYSQFFAQSIFLQNYDSPPTTHIQRAPQHQKFQMNEAKCRIRQTESKKASTKLNVAAHIKWNERKTKILHQSRCTIFFHIAFTFINFIRSRNMNCAIRMLTTIVQPFLFVCFVFAIRWLFCCV